MSTTANLSTVLPVFAAYARGEDWAVRAALLTEPEQTVLLDLIEAAFGASSLRHAVTEAEAELLRLATTLTRLRQRKNSVGGP